MSFGFEKLDNLLEIGHKYDPNIQGDYICILSGRSKKHNELIAEMFSECENIENGEHVQGHETLGFYKNLVIQAVYIENTYGNPIRIEVIELGENSVNGVSLDEYKAKMLKHDIYYEYSDDHSVWRAGSAVDGWLIRYAEKIYFLPFELKKQYFGEFVGKKIYANYINRMFSAREISKI